MELLFFVFGLVFVVMGIMAVIDPNSLTPKLEKMSGGKTESYKIHYNPMLIRIIGMAFVIFGLFFAFSDKSPF